MELKKIVEIINCKETEDQIYNIFMVTGQEEITVPSTGDIIKLIQTPIGKADEDGYFEQYDYDFELMTRPERTNVK